MNLLLRLFFSLAAVLVLIGCAQEEVGYPPPADTFRYPVSVAVGQNDAGRRTLYVASSNFDLLYNRGTVIAVDLDALDADGTDETQPLASLIDPEKGHVTIDSFAGMMALSDAGRLFVTTRSEHKLFAIDTDGGVLTCVTPDERRPKPQRCAGIKLSKGGVEPTDPYALAFYGSALYLTHGTRPSKGDSYSNSLLVRLNPETLDGLSYVDIGPAPSEGIIETPHGLYFSGKAVRNASESLRFLVNGQVMDAGVTLATGIQEGRGLGVSGSGDRLYMLTRGTRKTSNVPSDGPDGLLILDISDDPLTGIAKNQVLGFVPLPEGASQMAVIPRSGRGDLLAISCTDSDKVVIYDSELGVLTASADVTTPYGIASVPLDDGGIRLFVASFSEHSIQILDLEDLDVPTALIKRRALKGTSGI